MRTRTGKCSICLGEKDLFRRGDGKWVCQRLPCTNGVIVSDTSYHNQRRCICRQNDCGIRYLTTEDNTVIKLRMPLCSSCHYRNGRCIVRSCANGKFWEMPKCRSDGAGKIQDYCYMHYLERKDPRAALDKVKRKLISERVRSKRKIDTYLDDLDRKTDTIRILRRRLRNFEKQQQNLEEENDKLRENDIALFFAQFSDSLAE